jgi:hypothetical protein
MSSRYLPAQTDGEHGRATQLLEVAVSRQSRLRAAHEAAQDTPYDMSLDAGACAPYRVSALSAAPA